MAYFENISAGEYFLQALALTVPARTVTGVNRENDLQKPPETVEAGEFTVAEIHGGLSGVAESS